MAVVKPWMRGHEWNEATLTCETCGVTMELLEWKQEPIYCNIDGVMGLKRDRYFYDLGRSSRNDEIADLELKAEALATANGFLEQCVAKQDSKIRELNERLDDYLGILT